MVNSSYVKKVVNTLVIILAGVIAFNLYQGQFRQAEMLRQAKELELKKNETLGKIALSEQKINDYKAAVNNKDISNAVNTLGSIARDSGVKIISLRPGEEKPGDVYTKFFFQMNIGADNYDTIGRFLAKLENSPEIFIVESIKIAKQGRQGWQQEKEDSKAKLTADLEISTILLK